jgi:hypothetical protein
MRSSYVRAPMVATTPRARGGGNSGTSRLGPARGAGEEQRILPAPLSGWLAVPSRSTDAQRHCTTHSRSELPPSPPPKHTVYAATSASNSGPGARARRAVPRSSTQRDPRRRREVHMRACVRVVRPREAKAPSPRQSAVTRTRWRWHPAAGCTPEQRAAADVAWHGASVPNACFARAPGHSGVEGHAAPAASQRRGGARSTASAQLASKQQRPAAAGGGGGDDRCVSADARRCCSFAARLRLQQRAARDAQRVFGAWPPCARARG